MSRELAGMALVVMLALEARAQGTLGRWTENVYDVCATIPVVNPPLTVYCTHVGADPNAAPCFAVPLGASRCLELHPTVPVATLYAVPISSRHMREIQAGLLLEVNAEARLGADFSALSNTIWVDEPPGMVAIVRQQRRELGLPVP